MHKQNGQTIIETIVAVFILAMGIGAAIGLASYSLNATQSIRKQIIAMGLAREGLEVVKHMRDTNWLRGTLSNDCYNFENGTSTASCYKDWLNPNGSTGYNLTGNSGNGQDFYIKLNTTNELAWTLMESTGSSNQYAVERSTNLQLGLYEATDRRVSNAANPREAFGRKITIIRETGFAPYNTANYQLLKVTSEVWWSDRKCPVVDLPPTNLKCKVIMQTYLTNWKDY